MTTTTTTIKGKIVKVGDCVTGPLHGREVDLIVTNIHAQNGEVAFIGLTRAEPDLTSPKVYCVPLTLAEKLLKP